MDVTIEQDERGVATLTIANAARLNTLNTPVMTALLDTVEPLAHDPTLRVVVLRGEGERAFVGGADIREMAGLSADSARGFITLVHRCCDAFRRLPVPVIARIAGYTLGAGLELAAACDIRVAGEGAMFGMPEVRLGIPSVVEAALLPGLIGWGRTRHLLLTGETIDAETAERWGLVEHRVPDTALDSAVQRVVRSVLDSEPQAVRLQKALIAEWEDLPLRAAIQRGIDSFAMAWETDEPNRLMAAFVERMGQKRA